MDDTLVSVPIGRTEGSIYTICRDASYDCGKTFIKTAYNLYGYFSTVGTFGEKYSMKLSFPISVESLPRRIPHDIHSGASYATLCITAGPVPSKWK